MVGDFFWGVGILEGLVVDGREFVRGVGLCVWGIVFTFEYTDWIFEMLKFDVSLFRRLLVLLLVLFLVRFFGRLGVFLGFEERG